MLGDIIDWHQRGAHYNIYTDPQDGLLYAGDPNVQFTWMDAKVGNWVVTPRIGKPVKINVLWFNALRVMTEFAERVGHSGKKYTALADRVSQSFTRFWNGDANYCFDVIDGPEGDDPSLRPNQLFAVSLPNSPLTPGSAARRCGGLRLILVDLPWPAQSGTWLQRLRRALRRRPMPTWRHLPSGYNLGFADRTFHPGALACL